MVNDYRSLKRYLVLNMVNHFGPVSRTKLIALTDYRPASVGEITRQLLQEKLLTETGHISSGHGRKRELLDINKEHLCAIGIGFAVSAVTCIIAQFNGVVLHRGEIQIEQNASKEELAGRIAEKVTALAGTFPDKEIVGIGLCDPLYDPTNYRGDSILSSYHHFNDWIHFRLKPGLEQQTGLKVRIFSAVTLPALAEQRFGAARGVNNFICVELSNGIGSSICCNGQAVAGSSGVAGELGHTVVDAGNPGAPLCYCGKAGCVERTTAFPALSADIRSALDKGVSSVLNAYYDRSRDLTVADIRRALEARDQLCMYYVRRCAARLGVAIANAVNLLNPELVVLYGFMTGLGSWFLEELEAAIRENVLTLSGSFEIRISDSLERDLPLGAVAELFSSYLKIDDYKWVYQLPTSDAAGGDPDDPSGER